VSPFSCNITPLLFYFQQLGTRRAYNLPHRGSVHLHKKEHARLVKKPNGMMYFQLLTSYILLLAERPFRGGQHIELRENLHSHLLVSLFWASGLDAKLGASGKDLCRYSSP